VVRMTQTSLEELDRAPELDQRDFWGIVKP
jgi:hypothetical protein